MPWRPLDLLTSHSHLLLSQPPPVSAGPCPVFPAPGPTPPPPAGSCGSKLPHRLQPEKHTGQGLICDSQLIKLIPNPAPVPLCATHFSSFSALPTWLNLSNKQTWFNQEHVNHTRSIIRYVWERTDRRYVGLDIGSGAGLRHTVRTTLYPTLTDWHQSAEKA